MAQKARSHSQRALLNFTPSEPKDAEDHARFRLSVKALQQYMDGKENAWDGFVLDLSEMPLNKAVSLLEGLAPVR
jgi:hypothetical protein